MAANSGTPPLSKALIDYLERLWPDRMPDPTNHDEIDWRYKAGQVSVVRKLKDDYEKQSVLDSRR